MVLAREAELHAGLVLAEGPAVLLPHDLELRARIRLGLVRLGALSNDRGFPAPRRAVDGLELAQQPWIEPGSVLDVKGLALSELHGEVVRKVRVPGATPVSAGVRGQTEFERRSARHFQDRKSTRLNSSH